MSSISVIIALHNAAPTIRRTLQSLAEQTHADWTAIVVDDASTDDGPDIVRALARSDSRITLLRRLHGGPGAARNLGLDDATGDSIAFLDADDWLEPAAFEHLLLAARATGAACGRCRQHGQHEWTDPLTPPGSIGLDQLLTDECFAIHSQLIRRDLVGHTRFRTDLPCCEDLEFFLTLAGPSRGVRWTRTNHIVCNYRLRPRERGAAGFVERVRTHLDILQRFQTVARDDLSRRALNYATLTLLQDSSPFKDVAASIVSLAQAPAFTDAELARSAHAYLPLSEETSADSWQPRFDHYTKHLRRWWQRCIGENWTTRAQADAALPILARLIANSLDIPTRLIDTIADDRPVVVLGLGTNGVRLANSLTDRGIPFTIRDDGLTPAEFSARLPESSARRIDGPFDPRAQYLMSVLDDEAFLAKLPRGLSISRWSDAVDTLSQTILSRLRSALSPQAHPMNTKRPLDLFLGSYKRPEKLAAMIESVRETGYPARILVAAGDLETVELCARYPDLVECVFNTEVNKRIGCTAPLNHVYKSLVRRDALFCTDDCIFARDALDIAMETLYTRFPDGDGVVGLKQTNIPDGYDLAFPLMGRKFLDRFAPPASGKDLFFPGYFHLFNDAEIGVTIKCLGNWVFEPHATISHWHPSHGGSMDSTHSHGLTHHLQDQALWSDRRASGNLWGIDEGQIANGKSQIANQKDQAGRV